MAIPNGQTLVLGDGSTLGYYTYGDPTGAPVVVLHGVPACGAGFQWADRAARERKLRLLAPDRPGVGRTSRRSEGWTVASYADMVRSYADALGLSRFGVWGYSGGGPYAVACAAALPDRITAVVVAAGMGQLGVWASVEDFEKTDRQMLDLALRRPWLARRALAIGALAARLSPKSAMKSFARELSASDREVLAELGPPAEAMALFTQAFTNGPRGVVDDYAAIARPWECDVSAVAVPVHVMHGSDDTMVPLAHAEALVASLPDARLTVWPGEGHLATVRHVGEILDVFLNPPDHSQR